ncbi:MAG TPA: hypothetical protein VGR03_06535 [Candidatus Acidoferrum sp.]|nr:hypothetical protein [Candidatus Acidoferrum sp.]
MTVGLALRWGCERSGRGMSAELDAGRAGLEVVFVVDGGEGAEEQVAGVGHDGGAARGDAVVGFEKEEPRKKTVDVRGGGEFGELASEVAGEIVGVAFFPAKLGVAETKMRFRVEDAKAAAAA